MASYKRIVLTEHDSAPDVAVKSDIKKQLNKFDTTYTSKKLNELYNEFDAMAINNEVVNNTIVKNNAVDVAKPYEKFKVIVYLTTAIIVTALMLFLSIYNIFVIKGLNGNIQLLQDDVEIAQAQYDALRRNYGDLTDQELQELINETFNNEYIKSDNKVSGRVNILDTKTVGEEKPTTNWFDQFCTFISNIFGG